MSQLRPEQEATRLPPHDFDAEMALLGACLISAAAIAEAREIVTADDFYKPSNAHVFTAICSLGDKGQPADAVTVHAELVRLGLADVLGIADLTALVVFAPSIGAVGHYCEIVAEAGRMRRLGGVAIEMGEASLDPTRSSASVAEEAEARLLIAKGPLDSRQGPVPAGDLAGLVLDRAEAIEQRGDRLSGLPTGFADLDQALGGLEPGALCVVGARPSMGKTAFGLCIAEANARHGTPTLFFSVEMAGVEIGSRLVAMLARVGTDRQRSGQLRPEEWCRLTEARSQLASIPLQIDDRAAPTLADLRLTAKATRVRSGLGLVIVDYLQLIQAGAPFERRELVVAEVARGLKALARDLGCVVIALSQLNRSLEARADKRPILSDLRESGAIEQDADVVMFIYRDEIYNPESLDRGVAEVLIAKHRNGPTGNVRLSWNAAHARFANLDSVHLP
ncbi:MAG: replicative DNA helicase [Acidimicrobiales bacterium]